MKLRIAFAAAAAMAAAGAAHAAPASATANASATIVAPSALTATRDLDFGTVAKPTSGTTTVTVNSDASNSATPNVSGGNGYVPTPGQARAAKFHILGAGGQTYSITTPTLSFAGQAGNLGSVGPEAPIAASGTLNTLPANGTDDLYIGGHFDVTSATAVQTYSGTLALTVNLN